MLLRGISRQNAQCKSVFKCDALPGERHFSDGDIYSFRSRPLITYSTTASPFKPPPPPPPHFMVAQRTKLCYPESSMKLTPLCIRLIVRIAVAICEHKAPAAARLCDFPCELRLHPAPRVSSRRTSAFAAHMRFPAIA